MTKAKILIVDDEPYNLDYLEQELEGPDYEIFTAANGQEALDAVEAGQPDLILLDIMMPVMDGFEVLSRLKTSPETRDIPVIVISASSDLQSVVRGIQLGAEDYLPKPFEPTLLMARVSSSLEKKRLRDLKDLYLKGLERELDIAREIQLGFLPTDLPGMEGWEIAAFFKAAHEVAGDYYDFFLLPDGNLACVIGDVCDKGVGAALFMTLFRSLIRATATSDIGNSGKDMVALSPAERLQHVISFTNNYLNDTHEDANMFSTVFIGIVDFEENKLHYINCGNDAPLVVRDGRVIAALASTGPAVGVIPQATFTVKQIEIARGDILLAYTDGVPDARSEEHGSFTTEGLMRLLNQDNVAPTSLLEKIQKELYQFMGETNQFDDITMIAVQRCR